MKKSYTVNAFLVVLFLLSSFVLQATSLSASKKITSDTEACNISIDCPPNQTETVTPTCIFIFPDYSSLAVVTDACAPPTITQSPSAGTLGGLGLFTITLTANDGSNIANCTFDILVIDTTSPTLTCPIDQVEIFDSNCQFVLPDYTAIASATDACSSGSIPITQTPAPGEIISGTTTIFLFATDDAGNTGACTFQVIANDITPPTILCPEDRDESADLNCVFIIPDYSGLASASDNCGNPMVSQTPLAGTIVGLGFTAITLIATDGSNNTPCIFIINVIDDRPPLVNCPLDRMEDFDVNCQFLLPDYSGMATVTDACYPGPFALSQDPAPGTTITGNTVVTIFAEDNVGNIGSCSFQILQNDVIPPTISCPANQIEQVNTAGCMFTLLDYSSLANAFDTCSPVTVSQTPAVGSIVGEGPTMITLTADDGGNTSSCSFILTVEDSVAPNAVCTTFSVPLDASGMATISAGDVGASSNDFCGIASLSINVTSFTCEDIGANTVVLTVVDSNGNSSTCSATVIVEDPLFACNQPPVAICQPVIVSANANCEGEATVSDFDAGSFDPDGLSTTMTLSPVGPYSIGVTSVVITIDDGAFSESCTTTITVLDTTPPMLDCLSDQFETIAGNCTFVIPDYRINVNATDNCSTLTVSQTPIPGTPVFSGVTVVQIFANDGTNEVVCSFNLNIIDDTAPTAVCQNVTLQLDSMGTAILTSFDIDAGSSDNCAIVSMELDINSFTCDDIGVNTVLFTVTDSAGLTNVCNAIVTIEDALAPNVICQNITIALDANNLAEISAADIDAGSTDNCGIASAEIDVTSFDCSMVGDHLVTLTVTDVNGNIASCTAVVTVEDTQLPIAICQSITVQLDENGLATIATSDIDLGSSDNCGNATTSLDTTSFDCSDIGDNTVVFSIEDGQGNVVTCNAVVTVQDVTPPVLICQNISINLDEDYLATLTLDDITVEVSDNCSIVSTEISVDTFDCSNVGVNEIIITIVDEGGNVASCTAMVTIEEGIFAPNAVCQNVTLPLQQDGTATVLAIAFDGGSTGVRCIDGFSINRNSFTCEDVGAPIQIEFTVYNAAGVADTCAAFVNVVDSLAPNLTCPGNQYVTSDGPYILPDYFETGEATATDNCSSSLSTSQDPDPGTVLEQGNHVVTLTAVDVSGFEIECEFIVYVDDILGDTNPENSLETIVLYPNPANDVINISNPQFVNLQEITIYDISGRVVKQHTVAEANALFILDISNLQSATYLIMISTQSGQVIKQLAKE
ncbi:HYR domain-containing protein [Patiriisocius sp. Uisw_017]|uniref:HYR domain-containing protein n=1 Tax=Patiriisocius sp. Uisw_017 TaxID=3230968 RepID=UPI0039E8C6CA